MPCSVDGFVLVGVIGEFFVPQYVGEVYDFCGVCFEGVFGFTHLGTLVVRHAFWCVE